MKSIILTCPFTGVDFEALVSNDGKDYIFTNPLTGQMLYAKDGVIHTDVKTLFAKHARSVTPVEASKMLGVTRQRLTQLMREGKIPYYLVNEKKRILVSDIEEYLEQKKR